MVLIDPRELETINDAVSHRARKIEETTTGRLESDMKRTLDRTDLSADDMMRLYHQFLQRYLQKDQRRKKEPLNITVRKVRGENLEETRPESTAEEEKKEEGDNLEGKLLKAVPSSFKVRAKSLLSFLRGNKSKGYVDWTPDGELIASGKLVPGSSMVDLIHDSLKSRKGAKDPVGLEPFIEALALNNTPDSLITNTKRRRLMKEGDRREKTPKRPSPAKKPKRNVKKSRAAAFPYDGKLWELYK